MYTFVARPYHFFDPAQTLSDLHEDIAGFCELAQAYLLDVDSYFTAIADCGPSTQGAAHRLRTAFGIFHGDRGSKLSQEMEQIFRKGELPRRDLNLMLLTELIGLAEELQLFLADAELEIHS